MAVPNVSNQDLQDRQARFAEWSGLISYTLMGLGALLVGGLLYFFISNRSIEEKTQANRSAWDQLYAAQKDKKTPEEIIKSTEEVLPSLKGTVVYPFVVEELAQFYFELYRKVEKPMPERMEKLAKSKDYYDQLAKEFGDHVLYGAYAADGGALVREQLNDSDGAIEILSKAVTKYEKHYLAPKLSYELARMLWIRAQKKPGEAATKDLQEAQRWIAQAAPKDKANYTTLTPDSMDFRAYQYMMMRQKDWRRDALFLKSLLDKPGPGLPTGVAPPIRATTAVAPVVPPAPAPGGFVMPQNPTDLLNGNRPPQLPAGGPTLPVAPVLPTPPVIPAPPAPPVNK